MKNYKYLVPLVLIFLMGFSIFSMISTANKQQAEYDGYIEMARAFAKKDLLTDAMAQYELALEMDSDNVSLYKEIGDMYLEKSILGEAENWGDEIVEMFPEETEGYELLFDVFYAQEEYTDAFELKKEYDGRGLHSDKVDKLFESMKYLYKFASSKYTDVGAFIGGFCPVATDEKWGYIGSLGTNVIQRKYSFASGFANGVAAIIDETGDMYFIDTSGNKTAVLPEGMKCTAAGILNNGVIPMQVNGKYAFYDKNFNKVFGDYEYASNMNFERAAVYDGTSWYIINAKGEKVTDTAYESIKIDDKATCFRNDRMFVKIDGSYIMVDGNGKQIGEDKYEDVDLFAGGNGAAVCQNDKWGFIDKDGKFIIECQYDGAKSYSCGFAAVEKAGHWGYINEDNEVCIDYVFEDAKYFTDAGITFVKEGIYWKVMAVYSIYHR